MQAEEYFSEIYGTRWKELRAALSQPARRVSRILGEFPLTISDVWQKCAPTIPTSRKTFILDAASFLPAILLWKMKQQTTGARVLDLCAAPAGKSLLLLDLFGANSEFQLNEYSRTRFFQMKQTVTESASSDILQQVQFSQYDGNDFGLKRPAEFDAVLLDAPCSSERHLLEQGKFQEWTLARSKSNAMKQYSLICSAGLTLRAGGAIVYSTCSISPQENDEVVGKFLRKKKRQVWTGTAGSQDADFANNLLREMPESVRDEIVLEPTEFGYNIFPDRSRGFGPIYFAGIR